MLIKHNSTSTREDYCIKMSSRTVASHVISHVCRIDKSFCDSRPCRWLRQSILMNFTVFLSSISRGFRATLNERCQIYQFRAKNRNIPRYFTERGGYFIATPREFHYSSLDLSCRDSFAR